MSENPLLTVAFHIPFDSIRAEHVEPGIREAIGQSQRHIDSIVQDEAPRSFSNTMVALENSTENLDYALSVVRHLESVSTTPELRAAWKKLQKAMDDTAASINFQKLLDQSTDKEKMYYI